jgi:cystathionine beta-synthase
VAAAQVAAAAEPDAVVVVLLPDGGRGYLSKIFDDGWMADYGFLDTSAGEATVGEIFRSKAGDRPELVHVHPHETVGSAIAYLREFSVSQMPVVRAEPPVMAAEVAGTIDERDLLDLLVSGAATVDDTIEAHMSPVLPLIGSGEPLSALLDELQKADAVLVVTDGTPRGILSRQDVLGFLAAGR